VFPTIPMQKLVNFGHGEGHYFEFQNLDMENLEKIKKVAAPAYQRPTPAHGRVSRPARTHACAVTPRRLRHRPPPCAGAVGRPPSPLHTQPMQPPPSCHTGAEFPFASSLLTSPLLCCSPMLLCCRSILQAAPSAATASCHATSARLMSRSPPTDPEHASVRKSSRQTSA
jgi:hypothetical protein